MKKLIFIVVLVGIVFTLTTFLLNEVHVNNLPTLDTSSPEESSTIYKAKIAGYEEWLQEQSKIINTMNENSDLLKEKDKKLDKRIRELDQESRDHANNFDDKYPGFNMDGQY